MFLELDFDRCAKAVGGELQWISESLAAIHFGETEIYSLAFVCKGDRIEACFFRDKQRGNGLEFAFHFDRLVFNKNPYGGSQEAVSFADDHNRFTPLTIIFLGSDRREFWLKSTSIVQPTVTTPITREVEK